MMCYWCENPEPLEVYGPSNWCKICFRYSKYVPEQVASVPEYITQQGHYDPLGYLKLHACVMETTFIGKDPESIHSVLYKCINPVRANLSSEWLSSLNRCNKRFTLSKADWDTGQEKKDLALLLHSWEWHNKFREEWKEKEAKKQASRLTQEEMKNHPKYAEFLKLQENTKV